MGRVKTVNANSGNGLNWHFQPQRHVWIQLLLGSKTGSNVLVGGHEGLIQSRGKDYSLRQQADCPSHGQQTGVQNKTWFLIEGWGGGGRRGGVGSGLSSRQENHSGPRNDYSESPMHGWSNIEVERNKIRKSKHRFNLKDHTVPQNQDLITQTWIWLLVKGGKKSQCPGIL